MFRCVSRLSDQIYEIVCVRYLLKSLVFRWLCFVWPSLAKGPASAASVYSVIQGVVNAFLEYGI
jgi:hypothetical protein